MTTYTAIPDGDIDTDSPLTQSLMTLLRDNPLAQAEGASGATRNTRASIAAGVGHRWFFDYGNEVDSAIAHVATASIAPGLYQCTTFSIAATYTIDLSSMGPLIICATTSIIINGTLDVDGQGARGGVSKNDANQICFGQPGMFGGGGGAGVTGFEMGGGGTFLTAGGVTAGDGAAQSTRAIATLLSNMPIFNVTDLSSITESADTEPKFYNATNADCASGGGGGGGSNAAVSRDGGPGGGLVVLCAPVVTIGAAGVITADGQVGLHSSAGAGGGGAIIIATPSGGYTNGGTVDAAPGLSGGTGGDGATGWEQAVVLT